MDHVAPDLVRGIVRLRSALRTGRWFDNLLVFEWGAIVARCLAEGLSLYKISGMYVEFANVASPGDPVSIPALDRSRSLDYYNGLNSSLDRDYLRVDIASATVFSGNEALYPRGNSVTFSARTAGTAGVHGKPFGYASNSVVVGGALVAKLHPTDHTQDLLLSAFYAPVEEQMAKPAAGQLAIDWTKAFE